MLVKKLRYECWANTCQNVKMNPFGLSERLVYVFTFQGLVFDHRLSVQSVSLRVFWPESKAHDHSWLGKRKADICWVDWWFDFSEHVDELFDLVLRWRNWGWVAHLMSGSWEGLSCSMLPPDSPSNSLTGWALAQVPAICCARGSSTCLEPCLWSLGPQTHLLPRRGCGLCGMTLGLSS